MHKQVKTDAKTQKTAPVTHWMIGTVFWWGKTETTINQKWSMHHPANQRIISNHWLSDQATLGNLHGVNGNTGQPPLSDLSGACRGKTLLVKNLKWQQQSTSGQTAQKRQQSTDLWLQQQLCCYKQPPHPRPWCLCGGKKNLVSKKIKWKTNKINLWWST